MTEEEARDYLKSIEFCKDVARGLEPVSDDLRPTVPTLRFLDLLRALVGGCDT